MSEQEQELVQLETAGWHALSTDGAAAASFYAEVLDASVIMLLPGGMTLTDRASIIESMSGQPWTSFSLEAPQVLLPTAETGIVAYGVVARREGSPEYSALVSSHYVRRVDGWRLVFHQHTPR